MKTQPLVLAVLVALAAACPRPAHGWWDTLCTKFRPVPLVKEIEAEACAGADAAGIVQDKEADGGKGGKAVRLAPGGPGISTEVEVKPGLYGIWVIARDPQGQLGNDLVSLEVKEQATGQTRSWTMIGVYREAYFAFGQIYFPAYAGGKYTLTVKLPEKMEKLPSDKGARALFDEATGRLKDKTLAALYVDRLELRDVLGNCARKAVKTKRMLTSDAELVKARKEFSEHPPRVISLGRPESVALEGPNAAPWWPKGRSAAERNARNEEIWGRAPDFNEHTTQSEATPWAWFMGRNALGVISGAAEAWEKTGNAEFGWDGAVALCALAEKFPTLDFFAQSTEKVANLFSPEAWNFSISPGKVVYRGWAGPEMTALAQQYDQLFDFIRDNRELAAFVGTKIPGIKTPQDIIRLLDTNLLQAGLDDCERTYIEGNDEPKVIIPLVMGVSDFSNEMLRKGIFTAMCMNQTFRGGIDDQAVSSYSREGVHYIGSVGYLGKDLQSIAERLRQYREAGGPKKFDVLDDAVCPQMKEADSTIAQLRFGGGFRMVQGDAGDLRVGRDKNAQPFPSRVLGGFGATILDSGQFEGNPLKVRGIALCFGIGRGHAHQDTLNIELVAHGCRVSPDLGGRHEGKNHGRPNMRSNKVHNLVEVDGKNFMNEYAGSTTSGTGWLTSFSPQAGAQFMEHRARATSHPQVSLYARQTALVDVGDQDSYVFDVFRVRGGKVHTWCFHGCPTNSFSVSAPLQVASSVVATNYLEKHFEGSRLEGAMPAVLQADWGIAQGLQKNYQGERYDASRPVTTRMRLFNREGDKLMVGNASSEMYQYNFPFLYSQGAQEADGRESVFMSLVEPFAGTSFIQEARALAVTPASKGAEAPVALEVKTVAGATDLLYASLRPAEAVAVGDATKVTGRFACISRDAQGLRLAHLVGGTELSSGDVVIHAEAPGYTATITAAKYGERSFTVDKPLPARLLKGAVVNIGADRNLHAFKLESVAPAGSGTRLVHEKTARYFQSAILSTDEKNGLVEAEIEPPVFGCDPEFIQGTVIVNEKQDKWWRTSIVEGDRWVNFGFPGYRGSWSNKVSLDDFPDTNKDGRRILRLMGEKVDKDKEGNSLEGKVLVEVEVTRVSPDGENLYFKLPAAEEFQRGGWQFARRWFVNEDGSKRWRANYPGSSFLWKAEGEFKSSNFTDADGDGKAKFSAMLYGPGDRVTLDSFVCVRRTAPGVYEVRANVPCTVALPSGGASRAEISSDGKAYIPAVSRPKGGRLEVNLAEKDLVDGSISLRLSK
jgi:hypothetical protein